jgi:hypothetical protein
MGIASVQRRAAEPLLCLVDGDLAFSFFPDAEALCSRGFAAASAAEALSGFCELEREWGCADCLPFFWLVAMGAC